MSISGKTRFYGLIGDPIGHVKTPELYNRMFEEHGLDIAVVPMRIAPDDLPSLIAYARSWQNLVGIGVTIPHKESMTGLVDELTTSAALCGATNVIRRDLDGRLVGTQMDGPGFVWSLQKAGFEPAQKRTLLVGAGGTARALAFALADQQISSLTLKNRTVAKSEALLSDLKRAYPDCDFKVYTDDTNQYDLIVNATSLGMSDSDALPVGEALLTEGVMVADVVMSPPRTTLLTLAEERGCATHAGIKMLEAQFETTLEFLGIDFKDAQGEHRSGDARA